MASASYRCRRSNFNWLNENRVFGRDRCAVPLAAVVLSLTAESKAAEARCADTVGSSSIFNVSRASLKLCLKLLGQILNLLFADYLGTPEAVFFYGLIASAKARSILFQSSRGSAAARANVHRRTRSYSTPRRSESLRIVLSGSDRNLSKQLNRCWVAS